MSTLVKFDSLPRGARFRYAGSSDESDVYVKLEDWGTGLVAVWKPILDWPGQGIYTFADSPTQRAEGLVERMDEHDRI